MQKKVLNFSAITAFILCSLFVQIGFSQSFQRVESIVGLEVLEENNGVAVADYDGDNDLDIFVVAKAIDDTNVPKTLSRLFRNNNDGSFTDVTESSGLINLLSADEAGSDWDGLDGQKNGASWGDYNNDGFPDLFLTHSFKVQLFRNLGNGSFVDLTSIAGFDALNNCKNTGSTWFDYNNDGFLDIYVNDWDGCGSNQLFQNNGDNTFTNVTTLTGITNSASYSALPFDFNDDGFMDIFIANHLSQSNQLYISNSGTTYTDQATQFGLNTIGKDTAITIGDYNKDGFFDVFVVGIDGNTLFTNNGDNTFTENALILGLNNTLWSKSAKFSDFDLDGDEDVFIANGFETNTRNLEPNFYYRNSNAQGQNSFDDVSSVLGLNEQTISVEAIDWDYDNDGDIDLFVTNSNTNSFFYENTLLNFDDASPSHNWFKLDLQGVTSNRNGIGTIIKVTTPNQTIIRYKHGVGFLSQSLQPVHFGLDDETAITQIEISWPSGTIDTYSNLTVNTTMLAVEGQNITDLNITPSQKIYGCTDATSCNYNPNATLDDSSCTYLTSAAITGNTEPSFYSTETYTYPIGTNSTAAWHVEGGEIINGQGTDTISVTWELESQGRISVVETDAQCSSLEVSLDVNLSATNLPSNLSIARLWNETLLDAIRGDFARPTIHARNLFHTSVAMFDIWATYNPDKATRYLAGNTVHGFTSSLDDFTPQESVDESVKKAIRYAMYRILDYRFQNSPGAEATKTRIDLLMESLGYDTAITSLLYNNGDAAAFGNYIAQIIIDYGLQDGSRENTGFDNAYYEPVNQAYNLEIENNPPVVDPNRWQPLGLDTFIDQGGNVVDGNVPEFLSPEWGNVNGFALQEADVTTYTRNNDTYRVFHDPSAPPLINTVTEDTMSEQYKWGFSMVSVWQSHLDTADGVMWDISPGALGNTDIANFPTDFANYPNFYNFFVGGDIGTGHSLNPVTQAPYPTNIVPRADYARVLAEFWADGPDSETPPGHWFTILNYVNDHPQFEKRFQGQGDILDALEWDVKAYFTLGGGMHDAAIAAWSVKGWYDYIRPISAIRYMAAEQGQSSDPNLPNYSVSGIKLIPGYIELVEAGDPLAGFFNQNVGKVKLYTWRGHDFINNPEVDKAGVGWILAEDWYPYQRPTFVTPPFAGFVSGHSTYSRTASELLTELTGDPFFPGGVGEFIAKKDEFLVFEQGPSVDVKLQWATYRDASDQTSLSRIWGGIHPPADDIPGRFIGQKVADDTFQFVLPYFESSLSTPDFNLEELVVFPNPSVNQEFFITKTSETSIIEVFDISGRSIEISNRSFDNLNNTTQIHLYSATTGIYVIRIDGISKMVSIK